MNAELPFDTCCVLIGFGCSEFAWKVGVKMASKINKRSSLGRPKADIFSFCVHFWELSVFVEIRIGKNCDNNSQNVVRIGSRIAGRGSKFDCGSTVDFGYLLIPDLPQELGFV